MHESAFDSAESDHRRALPSVDSLLRHHAIETLLVEFSRMEIVRCIRLVLDARRSRPESETASPIDIPTISLEIREQLHRRRRPNLRRVINATGIVLHTGLGRAPLPEAAAEAVADVVRGYCNLEFDLESGKRGDRHALVRELLCELTECEDALVVNNNAAATYLALNSLAAGRGVLISRGQLVEIGGSYRMPDIMNAAGCRMIEVGTTNRTHLRDYANAIDQDTALLVRVHTSNYRMRGFTASPTTDELVRLARSATEKPAVIDDLGSGMLLDGNPAAAAGSVARQVADWDEPAVRASVRAGADLVLFSGDKLLGGPQAGIIVGRSAAIAKLRQNPLMRTFRPDKMTLAAVEATLRLYRDPESLCQHAPTLRMLTRPNNELHDAAQLLAQQMRAQHPRCEVSVISSESAAGGGSLPDVRFDSWAVRVSPDGMSAHELSTALRNRDVPIIARVQAGDLLFDMRTLSADDAEQIAIAVAEAERELRSTNSE
jgi:L-seryl-tRNA(Ser) seleniumtransferase